MTHSTTSNYNGLNSCDEFRDKSSEIHNSQGPLSSLDLWVQPLSSLLHARGLSARVSLGEISVVIGDKSKFDVCNHVNLIFRSRHTFERLCRTLRLIEFAKAFVDGELNCDGDIWQAVAVFDALRDRRQTRPERILEALYGGLMGIPLVNGLLSKSLTHYELDADAYELFLDRHMQYTCGYFINSEMSIDEAQEAKFHLIRDHVGLTAGSRHLDVGCGWGGLAGYFQREFGTMSIGLTNCASQALYARERFEVNSVLADFSALRDFTDKFDLITIVGMIEHLRPGQQASLFHSLSRLLKHDGRIYLQCIVRAPLWTGGDGSRFLQRNVFPGYFIDDASKLETRIQDSGFYVEKKMEHSEHYGYTTARWVDRIQNNQAAMQSLIGEREYRVFLGYLAMASKLFHDRRGCLMRYVLARGIQ